MFMSLSTQIKRRSGKLIHIKDAPVAHNPVYISTDKKGKYLFFTSYNTTAKQAAGSALTKRNPCLLRQTGASTL
jgi:6-phosphogluconolactonase (cycloisomerase 2 family)